MHFEPASVYHRHDGLMHDAVSNLSGAALLAYNRGNLTGIVYADDTLLLGTSDPHVHD